MKVRNVISLAAANLGREDLVAQAENCAAEPAGELASLLRCYNLVENEIALDYFPLKREDILGAEEGEIPFSRFSRCPVEVLGVWENGGAPLSFETSVSALFVQKNDGRIKVSYTYSPKEKEWGDDWEVGEKISARLLSFGICCEFCLTGGQYGEAAMWEKKFRDALRAANTLHKRLSVRSRRWA